MSAKKTKKAFKEMKAPEIKSFAILYLYDRHEADLDLTRCLSTNKGPKARSQ